MNSQLKSLEKAMRALQKELQEQNKTMLYAFSFIVVLAKKIGLTKKQISELGKEALKDLDKVVEKQEFRKIMKNL